MMELYSRYLLRWPWLVVVVSLIWVALTASGGQFLTFSNNYRVYFDKVNPQLLAFEKLQNTYNKSDNVLFVLTRKGGDVFTPEVLSAVKALTQAAWQTPYSIRVDSITNFQHTSSTGDDLVVADLIGDVAHLNAEELTRIRQIALNEPLLVKRLVSPQGHVTGVNITIQLPEKDPQKEVPEVATFVRNLAKTFEAQYPGLEIRLTGGVMMDNAFSESSKSDFQTLVPLMFVVIIVVLAVAMRTTASVIGTIIVIVLSIVSAMGLAGWWGIRLTPPTVSAPIIIMTISVANCMHLLTSFLHEMYQGRNKREAMAESLRANFYAFFLTNVTTVVGFWSMNFSEAPPFRDLGNILTMGVITNYLLCITFLPAFIMLLPVRVSPSGDKTYAMMRRYSEFIIRHRREVLWVIVAAAAILIAFIPKNELNDEFVKYFDESIEFRRDTDYASANLAGMYQILYSVESGQPQGVTTPEYLQAIEAFAQWYRQQPEVLYVSGITDIIKRLNQNMHGDDPGYYQVPSDRQSAAQYLLLYEMSLPFGLDLNDQINVDRSATRFTVGLHNLSSTQVLALEERAQNWLHTHAPNLHAEGTGPNIMFSFIGMRNIESMLVGTVISLAAISLVIIFALRSFRLGVISLIPNVIPVLMAFGVWGLLVGQVGLALSVVATSALGIIVDDTVHFLSKYKLAREKKGLSSEDAVRYAFSTVGPAIWYMSVVLIAGFLVLGLSGFALNSSMGILTAITIALALVADFMFLPPLLMLWEGKRNVKPEKM